MKRSLDAGSDGRWRNCYARAFDNSTDPLIIHDASGRIVAANQEACAMLGCSMQKILRMSLADLDATRELVPRRNSQHNRGAAARDTDNGLGGRRNDYVLRAISLLEGSPGYEETESSLRGADARARVPKERHALIMADMNHEIRTPLQAVMGMTDLLLETSVTNKQRTYLESIHNSGQILLKIIDDILDFSALESARLSVQNSIVDVASVISEVLVMLGRAAYSKDVELACRVDVYESYAIGDPDRIRQVLTNLVGNAVKFTDRGEVIVDASMQRDSDERAWIQFTVTDSGPGIDDTRKGEMFLPFSRIAVPGARRHEGAGLGLTISKHLVELMGGCIDIESRADTRGSVARFRLPAAEAIAESVVRTGGEEAGARVLVVDDNRLIGEATCGLLRSIGLEADLERDGRSALDRLARSASADPYRIAMIDADMPGMDGVAVALAIRSRAELEGTSIVMLTSLAHPLQPGIASRVNAVCLDKPIVPGLLSKTIERVFALDKEMPAESSGLREPEGSTILVAEDNPVSRQIFCDMLTFLGFEVAAVENGAQTLRAIASKTYPLILLDCQLPDLDGYGVAAEITANRREGAGPIVVAISANASADTRNRCNRAGADDFLAKPVTLTALRATLEHWLPRELHRPDANASDQASGSKVHQPEQSLEYSDQLSCQLIELFITDSEERIKTLSGLLGSRDSDVGKISRESHALKSGSLFLGQHRLAALAGRLEEIAREGILEQADGILGRLRDEFDRVRQQHAAMESPE